MTAYRCILSSGLLALALLAGGAQAQEVEAAKPATDFTRQINKSMAAALPFADRRDFDEAKRGFLGTLDNIDIPGKAVPVAFSRTAYNFIDAMEQAPDTVNPSLWRQAQLNNLHGLFEVRPGIYQVRGYDLANMTFVETPNGYIVIDTMLIAEAARAGLELLYKHRPRKPVLAVVYTHPHIDHFGGVRGLVDEADVTAGKVKIIAPAHFMAHAVSENVLLGTAMTRRAEFQFGIGLPRNAQGQVDTGLGKGVSAGGTLSLIAPTDHIERTGQTMVVDGVKMEFQMTPETEAPAEMNILFPDLRAICLAENVTGTMHNLYTLRGALVRDGRAWAYYIDEALRLYADRADVAFTSHHWPRWGKERIVDVMEKTRDMYKYTHDQSVRLANKGLVPAEIAESIKLPKALEQAWHNRGYYGTLKHNAKAVYQRYLGWYDGHPARLDPLPQEESAKRYVDFMGGGDAILKRARDYQARGEYRFVAEVLTHLVFAEPGNKAAKALQADALEQLGYQAESGVWRNLYLLAAHELRAGLRKLPATATANPDTIAGLTLDMMFDFLAVRIDPAKVEGKTISVNWTFTDSNEQFHMFLKNSVLNHRRGVQDDKANASVSLTRATWNRIALRDLSLPVAVVTGDLKISGNPLAFLDLMLQIEPPGERFNIVTP